jgi:long-chain acyl-CoA synthetase
MNPFRSGIGLLAEQTEAPILPIALRGMYELVGSPAGSKPRPRWFHAGCIEIRVGVPIAPVGQAIEDAAALAARLEASLRGLVERTFDEEDAS